MFDISIPLMWKELLIICIIVTELKPRPFVLFEREEGVLGSFVDLEGFSINLWSHQAAIMIQGFRVQKGPVNLRVLLLI